MIVTALFDGELKLLVKVLPDTTPPTFIKEEGILSILQNERIELHHPKTTQFN